MPRRILASWLLGASALAMAGSVHAQTPTKVRVRVVAHDAKVIGSAVGGAHVTVRDPTTGEVLAEGLQEGGTGDTRAIMVEPMVHGASVYDTPGAAEFTFTLQLSEPTVLEFIGEGPLGYDQAVQRSTTTMLVLPGEDILGDGIVLDLHGFIVEMVEPEAVVAGQTVEVVARVRMMCGCPQERGGLWEADRLTVAVRVYDEGELVRAVPLAFTGETNMFSGTLAGEGLVAGQRVLVTVADATHANFGKSETAVVK